MNGGRYMRKQIRFYILWDVSFTVFLYVYCNINSWLEYSYYREGNIYLFILITIVFPFAIGGLISWLVFISSKFQFDRKSAVLELVIIGGLGLYLATTLIFPVLVAPITGGSIPRVFKIWQFYGNTPNIIGSILLGYELLIFIIRMVKLKQVQNLSHLQETNW